MTTKYRFVGREIDDRGDEVLVWESVLPIQGDARHIELSIPVEQFWPSRPTLTQDALWLIAAATAAAPKMHGPTQLDRVVLVGGEVIYAHLVEDCVAPCAIHAPSDHHMVSWPQHWRGDRLMIERVCPHGWGHPDPDDLNTDTVHGCDGCCHRAGS